ncbi:MAG: hypothetical protein HY860_02340 [Chlamydiales bacterium]|nr:hypothetical protein [Chlamydiales bacterium]
MEYLNTTTTHSTAGTLFVCNSLNSGNPRSHWHVGRRSIDGTSVAYKIIPIDKQSSTEAGGCSAHTGEDSMLFRVATARDSVFAPSRGGDTSSSRRPGLADIEPSPDLHGHVFGQSSPGFGTTRGASTRVDGCSAHTGEDSMLFRVATAGDSVFAPSRGRDTSSSRRSELVDIEDCHRPLEPSPYGNFRRIEQAVGDRIRLETHDGRSYFMNSKAEFYEDSEVRRIDQRDILDALLIIFGTLINESMLQEMIRHDHPTMKVRFDFNKEMPRISFTSDISSDARLYSPYDCHKSAIMDTLDTDEQFKAAWLKTREIITARYSTSTIVGLIVSANKK